MNAAETADAMNIFVMVGPLPGAKSAWFQEANHVPGGFARSPAASQGFVGCRERIANSYRQLRAVIDRTVESDSLCEADVDAGHVIEPKASELPARRVRAGSTR